VSQVRVLVLGDGRHELGAVQGRSLNSDNLPALPLLIHRLIDCPAHVSYTCEPFRRTKPVHTKGHKYAVVAQHIDLDQLAKACPKGFAPFAEDVRCHISPVVTKK